MKLGSKMPPYLVIQIVQKSHILEAGFRLSRVIKQSDQ